MAQALVLSGEGIANPMNTSEDNERSARVEQGVQAVEDRVISEFQAFFSQLVDSLSVDPRAKNVDSETMAYSVFNSIRYVLSRMPMQSWTEEIERRRSGVAQKPSAKETR